MKSRPFHFKQFSIQQDHAAMKVGTDGVLLGAWASHFNPINILDIGCGTGLITLMMAQRFPQAAITGVEIDDAALLDAEKNVSESKWSDRITLIQGDIVKVDLDEKFDLIISNPPFFPKDTPSPLKSREMARSGGGFSLDAWIVFSREHLVPDGILALVLPSSDLKGIMALAKKYHLSIQRILELRPLKEKPVHRVLIELINARSCESIKDEMFIETDRRHHYSDQYINLTKDFYLKFP